MVAIPFPLLLSIARRLVPVYRLTPITRVVLHIYDRMILTQFPSPFYEMPISLPT